MYKLSIKLNSFCHKILDEYLQIFCKKIKENDGIENVSIVFLPVKINRLAYIRSFFVKSYSGEHIETRIYSRYVTLICKEEFNLNITNEIDVPNSIEIKKIIYNS